MIPDDVIVKAGTNMLAHTDMVPLEYVRQLEARLKRTQERCKRAEDDSNEAYSMLLNWSHELGARDGDDMTDVINEAITDARRYRWLRNYQDSDLSPELINAIEHGGDQMDDAIDNALRGEE